MIPIVKISWLPAHPGHEGKNRVEEGWASHSWSTARQLEWSPKEHRLPISFPQMLTKIFDWTEASVSGILGKTGLAYPALSNLHYFNRDGQWACK